MGAYVVRAKALHAEIVNKAMFLHIVDIDFDLLLRYLIWNEPECNRESVALQRAKGKSFMDALKTANLDLGVPVFTSLLSNQLLGISSLDGDPLCGGSPFVFVAGNLELSGQFSDSLGDIMNGLHRVNVGLVQGNLQKLRQSLIARFPFSHLHLSAGVVGQR